MNFFKLSFNNKPKPITQQFLAQNQDILAELVTFIDFAEGFTLGFIEINFLPDIDTLIKTLKTHPECQDIQFKVLDFSNYTDLRFIRDEIIKLLPNIQPNSDKKLVLMIRGLAKSIGVFGEYPPVLQDLNFVRDAYKTSVPHPLLFILPDYAITRLAKFAPDFWAWKSGVFRFKTTENTREEARLKTIDSNNPVGSSAQPESQERIDLLERLLMEYRPSGRPCLPENQSTCITILRQLGIAYLSRYQAIKAQEYLEEALKLAQQQNNFSLQAEVYQDLGRAYYQQRQFKAAIDVQEIALKYFEKKNNSSGIAVSLFYLGNTYFKLRDFQQASYYYRKALKISEDVEDFCNTAGVYHNLGNVACQQRNFDEAVQYYQKALKISKDAGDFYNAAGVYQQLGMVAFEQRNFEVAVQFYQKALKISKDAGDFYNSALGYHNLGNIACQQRNFNEAVQYYQKALKIYEDAEDFYNTANQYHQLGNIACQQQNFNEAVQYYQKALKIYEDVEDFYKAATVYHNLGNIAVEQRSFDEAVQYYQTALVIFLQAEDFYKARYPMRQLGEILQALGEDKFKAVWREAIDEEIPEDLYSEIVQINQQS